MRFVYGLIFGILASVIAAILYLAFAGGDYLLALSPTYHEMRSRLGELEKAEQQRAILAVQLETLEGRFRDLVGRFETLSERMAGPPPAADEAAATDEPDPEPPPASPETVSPE
jgi:uncharacterized protein involved in exopolysaccharide biosynthesis